MISSTEHHLIKPLFRTGAILVVPDALFYLSVVALLLLYGGHHHSYLRHNPFCDGVDLTDSHTPLGNQTRAPRIVLQISDLHVNDFDKGKAKRHLMAFEQDVVPIWGPVSHAVVVTGDLVNAIQRQRYPLGTRSIQIRSEWLWVNEFAARVNGSVAWLATHGNHDSFGGHISHHRNMPAQSEVVCPVSQPPSRSGQRIQKHCFDSNQLCLLAVDATQAHPLHRPLNFFGDATDSGEQLAIALNKLDEESTTPTSDVLAFSHYPSSVLMSGRRVQDAARRRRSSSQPSSSQHFQKPRIAAFLSGHLHSLYGLVPRGLSAISTSGAFEVEVLDMVTSGTFRVFAFDAGYLSVATFQMGKNNPYSLDDVVILNPPRAGFCAAGAGIAAMSSTHVRILSPKIDLSDEGVHLRIDGHDFGPVQRFNTTCGSSPPQTPDQHACSHVYGIEWNASAFAQGVHYLSLHTADVQSVPYPFSLDGSAEPGIRALWARVISSIFALSEFDVILTLLAYIPLVLSALLCVPGVLRRCWSSAALLAFSLFVLAGAPLLVAYDLSVVDKGLGWIGLHSMALPSGVMKATADAPFVFARRVLWCALLPACFVQSVAALGILTTNTWHRRLLVIPSLLSVWRCCWWTFEIWGAYGLAAAILSPGCTPLLLISLSSSWAVLSDWEHMSATVHKRTTKSRID